MFGNTPILRYWSRLSLSYRGSGIVTIPALCLLVTLGTWFWSRSAGLELREQIEASQDRIDTTNKLLIQTLNAETGVRGYLLTQDRLFLEPYRKHQGYVSQTLDKLTRASVQQPEQLAKIATIRAHIKSINSDLIFLQESSISAVATRKLLGQAKQKMDLLRREIANFQQSEQTTLDRKYANLANLQSQIESLQQLLTVAGVVSTIGGIYLFWLLEQELKEREAQVQNRNLLISTLTTDTIDGVAILDRAGQIETVNPALLNMFGYTAVDLLELPLLRILAPHSERSHGSSDFPTWLEQMQQQGGIWKFEGYRQDGTYFPIELSIAKIPNENQYLAIVRDVSEQTRLMQELQTHLKAVEGLNLALIRSNSSLERRNQELAEFGYVTAHDLKTPVRGIATLCDWIAAELSSDPSEPLQEYLSLLHQRTHRLNALIDGLWEYTNLGATVVTSAPLSLQSLFEELRTTVAGESVLLNRFPAGFEIEIPVTDIELTTNKSHLQKVLAELLENAVKHHDRDRGKVRLSAQISATDTIEFTIDDDGPGIPIEHHRRVFRLFETLESKDVTEHTGVGLAIAKKLVEQVGGKIWLTDSPFGRGLSVHFTWPQQPS